MNCDLLELKIPDSYKYISYIKKYISFKKARLLAGKADKMAGHLARWHAKLKNWHAFGTLPRLLTRWQIGTPGIQFRKLNQS